MYTNNPYAQGGWSNPENSHSINGRPAWNTISAHPPTFGALPPIKHQSTLALTFEFSSMNPDILDCIVTGPTNNKLFDIRTIQETTRVSKVDNEVFGIIQWSSHPTVEVLRGVLPQRQTRDFLRLSADRR